MATRTFVDSTRALALVAMLAVLVPAAAANPPEHAEGLAKGPEGSRPAQVEHAKPAPETVPVPVPVPDATVQQDAGGPPREHPAREVHAVARERAANGTANASPRGALNGRALQPSPASAPAPEPVAVQPAPAGTPAVARTAGNRNRAARTSRGARTRGRASRTRQAARPLPVPAAASAVATPAGTGTEAPPPRPASRRSPPPPPATDTTAPERTTPTLGVTRVVTRTVRDIAEVVPLWAWIVIAALGGLLWLATALGLGAAVRHRRLKRHTARLLDEFDALQEAVVPTVPRRIGGVDVTVAYRPAEGIAAGGDFFDVFPLERRKVGVILGDMSGHGREAVEPATFIRHMIRSYLEAGMTARGALQLAGNVLDDQGRDDFATVVVGIHDPGAGTLSYATAGHPPPIVTGPVAHEPLHVAASPPAGAGATTGLRQTTVALPPGSTVCFFTDGLSEARVAGGPIGRGRLEEVVATLPEDATADDLVDAVEDQAEQVDDDIAVCIVRPIDGAAAGAIRIEEVEVTKSDLYTPRLRRFFDACGVEPAAAATALREAAPRLAGYGSVLLRVRLAGERSGVDVVPVDAEPAGASNAAVSRIY